MKNSKNDYVEFDPINYKKTGELLRAVFSFQTSENPYKLILMGGAVKGGKSFSAIGVAILLCNTFPKCRGVIVRKTNKVIERNLLPVFRKLEWMINGDDLKKKEGDYVKNFNNGSQIILMSENYQNDKELNAFKGLDINFYIAEEGNELQEATFNMLNTRNGTNRHACDIPPISIITCNPSFGWLKKKIFDRFEKKDNPDLALLDVKPAPDSWLFIPSTAHDNPKIPKEQFDEWRDTMTPYDYMVMIEGSWQPQLKNGAFLKNFDPNKHLTPDGYMEGLPIHVTFDENVLPYITCSLWQIHTETKKLLKFAELPMTPPNNSAAKAGERLGEYLQEIGFNDMLFIYGDATSRKQSTLGDVFYNQVIEGVKYNFSYRLELLKRNESVAKTGAFVNNILAGKFGEWQILINERCGTAISDFIDTLEDENGGIKKNRVSVTQSDGSVISYEKNGHFVDAMRYFIVKVFWNDYKMFKSRAL